MKVVFCRQDCNREFSRQNCLEVTADLVNLIILLGTVHTRNESSQDGLRDM